MQKWGAFFKNIFIYSKIILHLCRVVHIKSFCVEGLPEKRGIWWLLLKKCITSMSLKCTYSIIGGMCRVKEYCCICTYHWIIFTHLPSSLPLTPLDHLYLPAFTLLHHRTICTCIHLPSDSIGSPVPTLVYPLTASDHLYLHLFTVCLLTPLDHLCLHSFTVTHHQIICTYT